MSSISETNNAFLLENKPYLTKSEVGTLLGKKGRNLDKKILQLLNSGFLLSLKKGLYTTKQYITTQSSLSREYLANSIYYPSYLSLEYVLQKEGLIPEAVYAYTSITLKTPRIFTNSLGTFMYRNIQPALFTGYQATRFTANYQIKIATRAKALFDLCYLKPLPSTVSGKKQELLSDLRIDWTTFTKENLSEFQTYVDLSASKKMREVAHIITNHLL